MKSLFDNKKAKVNSAFLVSAITAIVLILVIFELYAVVVPQAQTAGNTLNSSGVPLGSLFASNGVVFIIIMASLVLVIVASFLRKRGK